MKFYNIEFSSIFATIGIALTWLFGDLDIALGALIILMGFDYATGVLRAYFKKEVSSSKGFVGLARKGVIFIVLIVGVLLDRLIDNGDWMFRNLVCFFYIANEGISLLENCTALGLKVPAKLKDALIQLGEGEKKDINKGDDTDADTKRYN